MGKRGRRGKKLQKKSSGSGNNGGLSEELLHNHNENDSDNDYDMESDSVYSESVVSQMNNDDDGTQVSGDFTPILNDQLELLQEKREMTRVKALKKVEELLQKKNCAEWVDNNRDELVMILMNGLKRGKEKEARKAGLEI